MSFFSASDPTGFVDDELKRRFKRVAAWEAAHWKAAIIPRELTVRIVGYDDLDSSVTKQMLEANCALLRIVSRGALPDKIRLIRELEVNPLFEGVRDWESRLRKLIQEMRDGGLLPECRRGRAGRRVGTEWLLPGVVVPGYHPASERAMAEVEALWPDVLNRAQKLLEERGLQDG